MQLYTKLYLIAFVLCFTTQNVLSQDKQKVSEALDSMTLRISQIYHNKRKIPCTFCNDLNEVLRRNPYDPKKKEHNLGYVLHNLIFSKQKYKIKSEIPVDSFLIQVFDDFVRSEKVLNGIIEYNDISDIIQKYTYAKQDTTLMNPNDSIKTPESGLSKESKAPEDIQEHLREENIDKDHLIYKLWSVLGALVTVIVVLLGLLYKKIRATIEVDPEESASKEPGDIPGSITARSRGSAEGVTPTPQVQSPTSALSVEIKPQNWLIASGSAIGKGHLTTGVCQDSFSVGKVGELWHYMVVCDGAGSALLSDKGSQFITERAVPALLQPKLLEWEKQKIIPGSDEWKSTALDIFKEIKAGLAVMANENKKSLKDLASTVILVAYNSEGLLCAHIGDGRAAYRKLDKTWEPIMIPFKGKEANSTVFITSDWVDDLVETRVINDKISAVTAMSDGCEQHAFECSQWDTFDNKWHDPNRPFPGFFEPVLSKLNELKENGANESDINITWKAYLEKGTQSLQNEPDDKTMVIALNLSLYTPT